MPFISGHNLQHFTRFDMLRALHPAFQQYKALIGEKISMSQGYFRACCLKQALSDKKVLSDQKDDSRKSTSMQPTQAKYRMYAFLTRLGCCTDQQHCIQHAACRQQSMRPSTCSFLLFSFKAGWQEFQQHPDSMSHRKSLDRQHLQVPF